MPALGQSRIGTVSDWFKGAAIPQDLMNREADTTVRMNLWLSPDGRVEKCRAVPGKNTSGLRKAACMHLVEQARYVPAYDKAGNPVRGRDWVSVRWPAGSTAAEAGTADYGGAQLISAEITDLDFPGQASELKEADVALAVTIDANGRITKGCRVVITSSNDFLDRYTCALFIQRARFRMPVDKRGAPRETTGIVAVHWVNVK